MLNHVFEFSGVGWEEYGRAGIRRSADGGLEDDVDVAIDQLLVDPHHEFGFQAPVLVKPMETEVDAVGGNAVYDGNDFLGLLSALLDTDCGKEGS